MSRRPLVVIGLAVALASWVLLAADQQGSEAEPMVGMLALLVVAYGAGIVIRRWTVPVVVVVLLATSYAIHEAEVPFSGGALAGPLGYGNANGALYVQLAALAGMAAARAKHLIVRLGFLLSTLVLAALPVVVGSAAAAACGALVALATLLAFTPIAPTLARVAPAVAAVAIVLAGIGTVAVAEHYGNGRPDDSCSNCQGNRTGDEAGEARVVRALSERRVELWRDAERLTRANPLLGVGPGRFDRVSPIARFDADTRAAHSAVLEQGAETGLPGALLLLGIGLVVLTGLGEAGTGARLVALAGWTAFCLHAQIDYVANFPAVVAAAGLVAGLGTSWWRERSTD